MYVWFYWLIKNTVVAIISGYIIILSKWFLLYVRTGSSSCREFSRANLNIFPLRKCIKNTNAPWKFWAYIIPYLTKQNFLAARSSVTVSLTFNLSREPRFSHPFTLRHLVKFKFSYATQIDISAVYLPVPLATIRCLTMNARARNAVEKEPAFNVSDVLHDVCHVNSQFIHRHN